MAQAKIFDADNGGHAVINNGDSMSGIHVGPISNAKMNDIGTALELDVLDQNGNIVNISTATLQIVFLRPDGTSFTKTASLVTNGADGKMNYVTQAGDLNIPGTWTMQGVLTFSGNAWHTDQLTFKVLSNIVG